jgi:DNA-nicking Smr family endonuclease
MPSVISTISPETMRRRRANHPAFAALAGWQAPAPKAPETPHEPRSKPVSDDEKALFRAAVADVTRLPDANRAEIGQRRPAPRPRRREVAAEDTEIASPAAFRDRPDATPASKHLRPELDRRLLADLQRGRWPIESELDLHGYTREEARPVLARFIAHSQQRALRCVRVIHGKGHGPDGDQSILKQLTRDWLSQTPTVLAYSETKPAEGGGGALLVLLQRAKKTG